MIQSFHRPKAIFLDIDGTLVSFKTHQVPESTLLAIEKARAAGALVFIATGRPRPFINNLGALPYDGILCTNGASCLDAEGHCFHSDLIPRDDIERLIERQRSNPIPVICASNDDIFFADPDSRQEEVSFIMRMLDIAMPPVRPLEEARNMDVVQAVAFFHPGEEEEDIIQNVLKGCDANRWHYTFADCVAHGTNKASGIDFMLEHWGIGLEDAMAFGDGGNDKEMLQHVGMGVAMGNAADDVKAVADFVTTSVDEDGIANVLNRFF